jgi:uncharacterized RDD family membrane protein YckC
MAIESGPAGYMPPEAARGGPAGWWSRVGATILDGLIILVPGVLAGFADIGGSDLLAKVLIAVYLAAIFFYAPVLLLARDGRTWGKQAADIRVVRKDGSRVGAGGAFAREWLKIIFALTVVLWVIDVLWPLWHPENKALHDLATGTRVIIDRGRDA